MGHVIRDGYTREMALQSVGEGWSSLVNEAFDMLTNVLGDVRVIQVKEKFGGLRIYTDVYVENIESIITDIERRSFSICEQCGQFGELRSGGWYQTLCEEHANGRSTVDPF